MDRVLPYGTWPSPLAPADMARGGKRLASPRFVGDAVIVAESRPAEAGRTTLVRLDRDGRTHELVPAPHDVGTRVHEYGGRAWVEIGERIAFSDRKDGRMYLRAPDGAITALTAPGPWRFAEPIHDRRRNRLIAIGERIEPDAEPTAAVVGISLVDGSVEILRSGADFYAAPAIDPDGDHLALLQWNHPQMPWDAAALWTLRIDPRGALVEPDHVAGDARASAQQPVFAADGTLYFLWEAEGAWTLWRAGSEGNTAVIADPTLRQLELGGAPWNLGLRTWGLLDDRTAVAAATERGASRMVRIDLDRGTLVTIADGPRTIGHALAGAGGVLVMQGWDGRGSALAWLDRDGARVAELATGLYDVLAAPWWSTAEAIAYPTSDGDTAHAWFYRPHAPGIVGPPDERPPLVVMAHGGPTGCAIADAHLAVQFWTTRGFAVLDVNYRGSTGFGRAYRERLRGMWGVRDVDDVVAGARHLADAGLVDRERMIIRGASAGGFTVLAALAFHDVFAAGACHYGVSDVASLVRDTHKFEAHYDRFLFGEHADPTPIWRERSPLYAADRIDVPVVFFQGEDDPAVPPAQTAAMAEALRRRGIDVELRTYPGEGHGFRRAENIADTWAVELAFHRRVLAL